jgi:hypothetical protein
MVTLDGRKEKLGRILRTYLPFPGNLTVRMAREVLHKRNIDVPLLIQ